VVLGVDPVGREVVVDAHDGRQLWRGAAGQRALAVDDRFALVRGADGRALSARSFAAGRVAWRRAVDPKAQAALTPSAAVVVDAEPRRVIALDRASGAPLVEARTDARVLAVGSAGLVIGAGRDMAYLPFAVDAR
jgi:hypothetical protein